MQYDKEYEDMLYIKHFRQLQKENKRLKGYIVGEEEEPEIRRLSLRRRNCLINILEIEMQIAQELAEIEAIERKIQEASF